MVVVVLLLILLGSFGTAIYLLATGASWGMVLLGYLAGGWCSVLLGGVLVFLLSRLVRISWPAAQLLRPSAQQSNRQVTVSDEY